MIFGAESFGWKALIGIGSLIAGATVDAVGLAQGAVMTCFFVAALFFIRGFDSSRSRHAEVRTALESAARSE